MGWHETVKRSRRHMLASKYFCLSHAVTCSLSPDILAAWVYEKHTNLQSFLWLQATNLVSAPNLCGVCVPCCEGTWGLCTGYSHNMLWGAAGQVLQLVLSSFSSMLPCDAFLRMDLPHKSGEDRKLSSQILHLDSVSHASSSLFLPLEDITFLLASTVYPKQVVLMDGQCCLIMPSESILYAQHISLFSMCLAKKQTPKDQYEKNLSQKLSLKGVQLFSAYFKKLYFMK